MNKKNDPMIAIYLIILNSQMGIDKFTKENYYEENKDSQK